MRRSRKGQDLPADLQVFGVADLADLRKTLHVRRKVGNGLALLYCHANAFVAQADRW
jgi:hypothetical protein